MADVTLTPGEVYHVAKAQKAVLWCFLAGILLNIVLSVSESVTIDPSDTSASALFIVLFELAGLILSIALIVAMIYFVYKLATSLHSQAVWLWCVAMIVPCLNLICLLMLISRASQAIRAQGVKVGLMGADLTELERGARRPYR